MSTDNIKIRTSLVLSKNLYERLRSLAFRKRIPMAKIVREAIQGHLDVLDSKETSLNSSF